ncbi:STAS domain-containing protein [Amycolatopsis magusensis]|uniref:STAS domain-containing protein n=1 Tax=Amycolatopsis magusensis TaxID=882444 RepID=UPI003C2F3549
MPQQALGEPARTTPPPEWLTITHRRVSGALVVEVVGEVDLESASALLDAMTTAIDHAHPDPCIVDLTRVGFLNAAGLTALLDASRHTPRPRLVVDGNSCVIRPIEIAGLDNALKLYHSIEEAL